MADETILGTKGYRTIIRSGGDLIKESHKVVRKLNSAAAQVGMTVTTSGETYPDVGLAKTGDTIFGVILGVAERVESSTFLDIDDVIPDNTDVEILLLGLGIGCVISMLREATAGPIAVVPGDRMALGVADGLIRAYTYADAAEATDTLGEVIGFAAENHAGSAADTEIVLVRV